jgi:hypothetical protein
VTVKKSKTLSPTRFRFAAKVRGKNDMEREVVAESDDAHAGLLQFAVDVARASQAGAAVVEAKVTIFATRRFISTFKPIEGE